MSHSGKFARYIFQIYRAIPFLFELKNFLDWTMTKTSLNLMQWIKLEEIHAYLFFSYGSAKKFRSRKHGKAMSKVKKIFLGGGSVLLIFILILGPMLFFSELNPSLQKNLLTGCEIEIGLWVDSENYYKLYSNSLVSKINRVNDTIFNELFQEINYFQTIDRDIFQMVSMQENSEINWDITTPNYNLIVEKLNKTINLVEISEFNIEFKYAFNREVIFVLKVFKFYIEKWRNLECRKGEISFEKCHTFKRFLFSDDQQK